METEETAVGTHNISLAEAKQVLVSNKLPKQSERLTVSGLNVGSEKISHSLQMATTLTLIHFTRGTLCSR